LAQRFFTDDVLAGRQRLDREALVEVVRQQHRDALDSRIRAQVVPGRVDARDIVRGGSLLGSICVLIEDTDRLDALGSLDSIEVNLGNVTGANQRYRKRHDAHLGLRNE
jgi:hypothetical protein